MLALRQVQQRNQRRPFHRVTTYYLVNFFLVLLFEHSKSSSVTFSHDDVVCAENRDDVRNQVTSRHMVEGAHMDKRRRTDLQAIRTGAAVAHDEEAEFAFRRFTTAIGLRFGWLESLCEDDEMVDQAFHITHDEGFGRRNILWCIRDNRAGRQLVQALLDDARALTHFLHAHPITVVGVAILADRNLPIDLVIDSVWLLFSDVVGNTRTSQDRSGASEVDRVL